jgi:hypothetical protein
MPILVRSHCCKRPSRRRQLQIDFFEASFFKGLVNQRLFVTASIQGTQGTQVTQARFAFLANQPDHAADLAAIPRMTLPTNRIMPGGVTLASCPLA